MVEWLLLGYLTLLVVGFVLLRWPGAMASGNEMNVDRAVFTAVDAGTLGGFQQHVGIGQFKQGNAAGPAAVLLLTVGGAYFSLTIGGLAVVRALRMPYRDSQVFASAAVAVGAAVLVGTIPLMNQGRGLFDALLLAAAAFGNSGVHTGPVPDVGHWQTHLVILPLALLGGLGLPVLMELYDLALNGKPLSTHSKAVLALTAAFYVGGTLVLLSVRESFWDTVWSGLTTGGWTMRQGTSLRYALASSSVAAVTGRTSGLPIEFVGVLPRPTHWVLIVLMAVGANSASTGGGLKTTTLLQLFRGVRDVLAGRAASRAFGIAATWVAGYLVVVAIGFLVLLFQVPQIPADQLLFLSVSAASNVGLSHDPLSLVVGPLFTLSFVMLLGRLLPLLVLWWLASTTRDAELAVG